MGKSDSPIDKVLEEFEEFLEVVFDEETWHYSNIIVDEGQDLDDRLLNRLYELVRNKNGCWVNFLDPEKLAEVLGLPENEEVLMVMDLGYATEGTGPLPNHTNRKRLEQTVSYM